MGRTCIPKQIPMILRERFRGSVVRSLMKDMRRVIHGCCSYADEAEGGRDVTSAAGIKDRR